MGNSNKSSVGPQPSYEEIGVQQNQMLSHLIMLRDKNSQQRCMLKHINLSSEDECAKMIRNMTHRRNISQRRMGKYIIKVLRVQWKEVTQICGKNYKIMLYLEPIDSSLAEQYQERRRKKQPFTEDEIMGVLKAVTGNLTAMYDNSFKNIHLYKESMLLCGGQYKVIDSQLSNRVHPYFEILNMVPCKPGTYLAPQLLQELRKQNPDFYPSPKADIFTLAVIVLELATFHEFDSLYDYQLKTVNTQGLVAIAKNIDYSPQLKDVLLMMLQEDEEERVGLISLKQMLRGDLENMSLVSMRSESNQPKPSTRTTISVNRPISSVNTMGRYSYQDANAWQKSKQLSYNRATSKHESEYKPLISQKGAEPIKIEQQTINSVKLVRPEYKPVEKWSEQTEKIGKRQKNLIENQPVSRFEVRETPKATTTNHQFQTPVNMMYQSLQSQPEPPKDTPIQQIQTLVSAEKQPTKHSDFFKLRAYGVHRFNNGARYEGELNGRNEFDGNGMLYYPSGTLCYSGSWKSNAFDGFGVLHNEQPNGEPINVNILNCWQRNTWLSYQGEFVDDKKEGFGTVMFPNGDKFSGCFKEDYVQGFGSYYSAVRKEHVNGIWIKNILQK